MFLCVNILHFRTFHSEFPYLDALRKKIALFPYVNILHFRTFHIEFLYLDALKRTIVMCFFMLISYISVIYFVSPNLRMRACQKRRFRRH